MSSPVDLVSRKPHGYIFSIIFLAVAAIVSVVAIPAVLLFRAYTNAPPDQSGGFTFLAFLGLLLVVGAFITIGVIVEEGLKRL